MWLTNKILSGITRPSNRSTRAAEMFGTPSCIPQRLMPSCNNTNETRQDPLVADPYEEIILAIILMHPFQTLISPWDMSKICHALQYRGPINKTVYSGTCACRGREECLCSFHLAMERNRSTQLTYGMGCLFSCVWHCTTFGVLDSKP